MCANPPNFIRISWENYESSKELIDHGRDNAAANRLYYAVFQLLYMDMLNKGKLGIHSDRKHERIQSIAEEEYGAEISELFQNLKRLRVDADYSGRRVEREKLLSLKSQVDLKYEAIKKKVSA